MSQPVILLGHAGNYTDIVDLIEDLRDAGDARYAIQGFLDNREEMQGRSFHGYPVLGRHADAGRFPDALFSTWIGGTRTYLDRPRVVADLGLPPERFATLVHPTSYVSRRARLGHGVIVYQNCTLSNNVVLGDHVLVLPNTVLSHDDEIGDYTIITGGVAISGSVKVGRSCYIGTNCAIHQSVTVGEGSLVGMGSVVRHDVPQGSVVVGNPARILREAP
jgi:sugar O-acyltransferase (sialic acid O-acetyltransferase NeuD family)